MEKEEISLKQKVDILFNQLEGQNNRKWKKLKLPRKAKVSKGKIKKGWIGVLKIDENGNISGEKTKLEDSTHRLKEGTYHATDGREILFWQGKFPVIVQETTKVNPTYFGKGSNETYGQKYIMARMLKDAIKIKNKASNWIVWIIIAIIVLVAINYFMKGGNMNFFGGG